MPKMSQNISNVSKNKSSLTIQWNLHLRESHLVEIHNQEKINIVFYLLNNVMA